jgi:hypothetical protein
MEIPRETPWKMAENRTLKWGSSPPEQRRKFSVPFRALTDQSTEFGLKKIQDFLDLKKIERP